MDLTEDIKIDSPDNLEDALVADEDEVFSEYCKALNRNVRETDPHWQEKHTAFIKSKGMSPEIWRIPEPHCSSHWVVEVMTRRERQNLAFAIAQNESKYPRKVHGAKFELNSVDVTPSIHRLTTGMGGIACSFIPNSKVYLMKQERFMLGKEAMQLHGYPTKRIIDNESKPDGTKTTMFPNEFLFDLAGNMFTGTVYMAILLAALALMPRIREPDSSESEPDASDADDQDDHDSLSSEGCAALARF